MELSHHPFDYVMDMSLTQMLFLTQYAIDKSREEDRQIQEYKNNL